MADKLDEKTELQTEFFARTAPLESLFDMYMRLAGFIALAELFTNMYRESNSVHDEVKDIMGKSDEIKMQLDIVRRGMVRNLATEKDVVNTEYVNSILGNNQ